MRIKCNQCGKEIKAGEEYSFHLKIVCEDCYMNKRAQRVRKTHWRYLKSIKTEYLQPGK